jgi:hypothetical protein
MTAAQLFAPAIAVQATCHSAQQLDAYYTAQMERAQAGMNASGANYSAYRNYQADWAEAQAIREQLRLASLSPAERAIEAERQRNEIGNAHYSL